MKRFLAIAALVVFGASALTALTGWSYGELVAQRPSFRDEQAPANEHDRDEASAKECEAAQVHKPTTARKRREQAATCAQEAKSQRINEDSLTQTARGAHAAEESAAILFVQTEIGLIGTGLLAITLFASGVTAWGAYRAAKAADETLIEARKTSEKELRAYVFLSEVIFEWSKSQNQWAAQFSYRNSGNTPAYKVVVTSGLAVRAKGEPDPAWTIENNFPIGLIGPNGDLFWDIAMFEDATIAKNRALKADLEHHRKEVFLYGRINYVDDFGQPRFTNFRYSVGGELGYDDSEMSACRDGNYTEKKLT